MKFNLEKANWETIKFGDIAQKISNLVNPDDYQSNKVIKGGHINKRDIHIREYDNKNELGYLGPAFHMGFKKNQILYVSRNPHLVKVGYTNFDGICSNTTFIIDSVENSRLRKDLIPFVMLSDNFIAQSVSNVRGGVNPYVNWGDLAIIEFKVPPKEKQYQLSDLLWSLDETLESERKLLLKTINLKKSIKKELLEGPKNQEIRMLGRLFSSWEYVQLKDHAIVKGRVGWKGLKQSEYIENGPHLIASKHIKSGKIQWDNCDHITEERYQESYEIALTEGDIIFSKDGAIGNPALVRNLPNKATINSTMMLVRPNKTLNSRYFYHILGSVYFERLKYRCLSGSAIPHIFQADMKDFDFPLPPIEQQENIATKLDQIDQTLEKINDKINSTRALQISLINQIF
jgi:type I restriction enzyme, S subunit